MHNIITLYIAISIHKVCHTVQRRAKNIKKLPDYSILVRNSLSPIKMELNGGKLYYRSTRCAGVAIDEESILVDM